MLLEEFLKTVSQQKLADALGITQPMVSQWVTSGRQRRPVSPKMAIRIHEVTDGLVSKYELRPDLFGPKKPVELILDGRKRGKKSHCCPHCGKGF